MADPLKPRRERRPGPRTRAEVVQALAQEATDAGERLLAQGDAAGARPWLERAHRLAPEADNIAFALATALVRLGEAEGARLFADLAGRHDAEPVWIGLAAACAVAGDWPGAASALGTLLGRFRLADPQGVAALADRVTAAIGAPGWCGVAAGGRLVVRLTPDAAGRMVVEQDGAARSVGRRGMAAVDEHGGPVAVRLGGRALIGSPVEIARFGRVEGAVAPSGDGIEGWAWHPADPARDPDVTVVLPGESAPLRIAAREPLTPPPRPFARARRFAVPGLTGLAGALHVRDGQGRDLTGSPLDPGVEIRAAVAAAQTVARALPVLGRARRGPAPWQPIPADLAGPPARAPRRPRRALAVVVPVYRGLAVTRACLEAVFATMPRGTAVIVVDDASPEPDLAAWLDAVAAAGRLRLLRHARNLGFPAAANAGLRVAAALPGTRDAVLLNSDTLPAPGWLERQRAVVHAAPDIGTACPLSNDATILSYPDATAINPVPEPEALVELGALAAAVHPATAVDVPTGVGFCLYLRHECLVQTGLLRTDAFAQGYGEENDFCLRARRLGWRHVAVPGAYVAHVGGASFGDARAALLTRNLDLLERLHPGYRGSIRAWQAADPLAPARRALDAARWTARRAPGVGRAETGRGAVLLITHDHRGGVERAVRARIAAHAAEGCATVLLRPVADHSGTRAGERTLPGVCAVADGAGGAFPNLRFRLPEELDALSDLLRGDGIVRVEVHHLLGHDRAVLDLPRRLGVPYEVRVHDYAWFCPRITLVGAERRYCGEPEAHVCEGCVADAGEDLADAPPPALLRRQSAADLAQAARVVVPSGDASARIVRHFPAVRPLVAPHEDDADLPPLRPTPASPPARHGRRTLVAVPGAIGTAKGYDVLLACARDAAQRDLPLGFVVVGHTEDDARLLASGRAFVTGPYREEDAQAVLRAQHAAFAWVPSIWPETWCYALGHALRAGLAVAAFDIGAQAERIRATGRGWLLPLGLPAPAINNALLALRVVAGDECARPIGPGAVPAPAASPHAARAHQASFHDASTSTARS